MHYDRHQESRAVLQFVYFMKEHGKVVMHNRSRAVFGT